MNNNKDINITINDLEEVIDPSIKKTNNTSIKKKQTKTIKKKKTIKPVYIPISDDIDNKSKYLEWLKPDGLMMLAAWTRDGLTQEQVAIKVGINIATLYKWRKK